MKTFKEFVNEEMATGDSGGLPSNIASGTTTGAVTNKGPEEIPKKRKKEDSEK